ncbi:MAG TPA: hypothetical protein VM487_08075 [Phycisphaerae bacterium]|nr:hypothetical protein [Phycisphaerae bacterium]
MRVMLKTLTGATMIISLAALVAEGAAQSLTIYEIQFTEDEDGDSYYNNTVVDCAGGICAGKYPGSRPRLILQDPNFPDGWGGIQVKDWTFGDLFDNVEIGDWVSLTNMLVEEFRGTTFLQWQTAYDPGFTIVSQNNPLPPYLPVSVSDIPAPVYDPNDDGWYVENHDAEPYESMRLIVWDVTVTALDLGKEADNYNLEDANGNSCWVADYMNVDVPPGDKYHPFVSMGQHFCAVSGVFEQYTRLTYGWDYYQLVTLSSEDLFLCGDLNHDGCVDHGDLGVLLADWGCTGGNCPGDCDGDGDTDHADLGIVLTQWGEGCP